MAVSHVSDVMGFSCSRVRENIRDIRDIREPYSRINTGFHGDLSEKAMTSETCETGPPQPPQLWPEASGQTDSLEGCHVHTRRRISAHRGGA